SRRFRTHSPFRQDLLYGAPPDLPSDLSTTFADRGLVFRGLSTARPRPGASGGSAMTRGALVVAFERPDLSAAQDRQAQAIEGQRLLVAEPPDRGRDSLDPDRLDLEPERRRDHHRELAARLPFRKRRRETRRGRHAADRRSLEQRKAIRVPGQARDVLDAVADDRVAVERPVAFRMEREEPGRGR